MSAEADRSIARYKRIVALQIPQAVKEAAMTTLARHGESLAKAMRAAVDQSRTGHLKQSIRTERDDARLLFIVRAGGKLTTHPVKAGKRGSYDYAIAEEFGTAKESARPFFWPMYRLLKASRNRAVRGAITRAMKKEFHD